MGSETWLEEANPTRDVSVQPVVVVGAGGHAKVIIELIQAQGCYRVVGLIDADPTPRMVLGVQVIGADRDLPRLRGSGVNKAFVALGDNRLRLAIGRDLERIGFEIINAISPAAVISSSAQLGHGVAIMAGAVVNAATTIGDFAIVNTCASIDHDTMIGEGAHIGPGCALAGNVIVDRLACLGVGTSATPRTTVGEGALVGAGACIVRDIPAAAVARGVPARVVSFQQDRELNMSPNPNAHKVEEIAHSRISVGEPVLDGRETEYVLECLQTNWISSHGKFITQFERAFAEYCGVRHAVAVNNGTTALHLSLVALDVKPGDEIIVPTLSYVATANAVRYCSATPVFADNDLRTFNINVDEIEAKITPRTKGIMPVHLYGHPADMDPILEIADKHRLFVVEDAAEAIGARYKNRLVGGIGTCATFSFFGNKIITTGEGGMVTTNDDALAARLRMFKGQGMDPDRRYWFPVIGYNYRMTNIAAAIGLAQLERIEHHLETRKAIAAGYNRRLGHLSEQITLPESERWANHVYWMYTILLRGGTERDRDNVMHRLGERAIETRPVFYPMHTLPPYRATAGGPFPRADLCAARGINLPTHGRLTEQDMDRIAEALEFALN